MSQRFHNEVRARLDAERATAEQSSTVQWLCQLVRRFRVPGAETRLERSKQTLKNEVKFHGRFLRPEDFLLKDGAIIRVFDESDAVIETHEYAGAFKEPESH